jgi:hypothetical protein
MKTPDLGARMAWQFALVVLPGILLMIGATLLDAGRVDTVAAGQADFRRARAALESYESFLNKTAESVDRGVLPPSTGDALVGTRLRLSAITLGAEREAVARVDALLESLSSDLAADVTGARLRGRGSDASLAHRLLRALVSRLDERIDTAIRSTASATNRQKGMIGLAAVASLLLALHFLRATIRGVTKPLAAAVSAADRIAGGHIEPDLDVSSTRDIGGLLLIRPRFFWTRIWGNFVEGERGQ